MKYTPILILAAFSILLAGCDKNSLGTVDVRTEIPVLSNITATPDSINIDNQVPVNGQYTVNVIVSARASFKGSAPTVKAAVLPAGSTDATVEALLRDDGASPDGVANDSIYTGTLQFKITRAQTGKYRVRIAGTLTDGSVSNTLERTLKLQRRNARPQLLSVSLPDSVNLPAATDTLRVQFAATVADSDGLADIREVFFRRISPPDPTKFQMRDDGGLDPEVNIGGISLRSGDDIAGDGKYSFLIPVLPTSTRRTNVFEFQCIDSFGDTSNTVQRSFTIR